jgi:hypothetical protein
VVAVTLAQKIRFHLMPHCFAFLLCSRTISTSVEPEIQILISFFSLEPFFII